MLDVLIMCKKACLMVQEIENVRCEVGRDMFVSYLIQGKSCQLADGLFRYFPFVFWKEVNATLISEYSKQ